MNTLKENYKIIDGKLELLRNEMLSLIYRLKDERIDRYESTILTSLELANLYAWNAQIVNEGWKIPPFIEPDNVSVMLGKLTLESILKKVSKCLLYLASTIETTQEFEMLGIQISEDEANEIEEGFLEQLEQVSAKDDQTIYAINRVLDCLNDVVQWTKLEMERTNE